MPHYDPYAEEERPFYTLDFVSDLSPTGKQHYVTDPHLQHHSTLGIPASPASQVPTRTDSLPPKTETEKKIKKDEHHYVPDPHISHHNTLHIPSSPQVVARRDSLPPETKPEKEIDTNESKVQGRRDSCHRHLNVDEKEWADNSASWHNRSWLDSDFTPVTDDEAKTAAASDEKEACSTCSFNRRDILASKARMAGLRMGPCTCVDGSLHDHSPLQSPQQPPSSTNAGRQGSLSGHDDKRAEMVREARRQILFGDEKVSADVALEATERLRESEENMKNQTPTTGEQQSEAIGLADGKEKALGPNWGEEKAGEIIEATELRERAAEWDEVEDDSLRREESWDFGTWIAEGVERMVEVENGEAGGGLKVKEKEEEDVFVDAVER